MSSAIELPCHLCGNAAVRVDLAEAVKILPGKHRLAARGAARLAGYSLDLNAPGLGIEPAELSTFLAVTCIRCVDAAVDNNPQATT